MSVFLADVTALRDRARSDIMAGPVTSSYGADVDKVIELVNLTRP